MRNDQVESCRKPDEMGSCGQVCQQEEGANRDGAAPWTAQTMSPKHVQNITTIFVQKPSDTVFYTVVAHGFTCSFFDHFMISRWRASSFPLLYSVV
jgi:hypothetical protein